MSAIPFSFLVNGPIHMQSLKSEFQCDDEMVLSGVLIDFSLFLFLSLSFYFFPFFSI